jgi:hypothetical protein
LELAASGKIPENMGRETNYKDFAPRLGVAYRFDEKTVIRGGYGISIDASFPDDKYAFNFPVSKTTPSTRQIPLARPGRWPPGLRSSGGGHSAGWRYFTRPAQSGLSLSFP